MEGVVDIVSVKVRDHVTSPVSENVCVRDSDSVKDQCSGVFEGVSDFPSVGLSDRVIWSV